MNPLATLLITTGFMLVVLGLLFSGGLGQLGHIPGDIRIQRPHFTLYLPLTSSVIISIIITIVMWTVSRS